eukprot:CAMPEP_0177472590 /NCGR_PEP_ID=MMETSP0369-20130122/21389_1 /TAXON_ID=447022 ORGANISM="Scrippsiella hangoei-like, Strain SHHI-4" /NCGR_SAMPLE_ID=MMETSP0369 /ASSEMBLY_ACC=CAM_ASM_000364 /LENGTH=38 /DNA_ID= /DNA_START= /DNA_END= /DNA_ORIENTATION=
MWSSADVEQLPSLSEAFWSSGKPPVATVAAIATARYSR